MRSHIATAKGAAAKRDAMLTGFADIALLAEVGYQRETSMHTSCTLHAHFI